VTLSSGDVYRAYGVFTRLEQAPLEPTPITEDSPLRHVLFPYRAGAKPGDDKYDYEKILVERVVRADTGLPATVLRLPMVYGPGDEQHRLAPYLQPMRDGRPAVLVDEGLARWRCLRGYVEDVAEAVALAVMSPASAGRVYNVAEPTAYTEAEWVARIGAVVGWGGAVVPVPGGRMPVPFDTAQALTVDTTRIRAELGYREGVDPDDALRATVEWERKHLPEVPVDYAQEDRLLAELRARTI
jgi:nucleoside-diphosphate-sugar epimerase